MRLVWVHHSEPEYEAVRQYLSRKIFRQSSALTDGSALVVLRGNKPVGAFLVHNWTGEAAEISVATDRPGIIGREVWRQLAQFVFGQLGCSVVLTRSDAGNKKVQRLMSALGANIVKVPDARGVGRDETITTLTKAAWETSRFNKEANHGR